MLKNISFSVKADNKIAVLSDNELATTLLFQIIAREVEPDSGEVIWGQTITKDYFPKDNSYLFERDEILVDWLRKYSKDPDETDMESITALNEGMKKFKGNLLFTSHDHQLTQTVADRIIDLRKEKIIDRECTYNEYLGIE